MGQEQSRRAGLRPSAQPQPRSPTRRASPEAQPARRRATQSLPSPRRYSPRLQAARERRTQSARVRGSSPQHARYPSRAASSRTWSLRGRSNNGSRALSSRNASSRPFSFDPDRDLPDYESEGYSPPFQSPYAGLPIPRHDAEPEDEDDPSRSVPSTAAFDTLFDHMENGFGSEFGDPMGSESPAFRHDSAIDGISDAGLLPLSSDSEDSEDGEESGSPGSEDIDRVLVNADYGFLEGVLIESDGWTPTSPWGDGLPRARSNSDWSPTSPWEDGSPGARSNSGSHGNQGSERSWYVVDGDTSPQYRRRGDSEEEPEELEGEEGEDLNDENDPCIEIRRDRARHRAEEARLRERLDHIRPEVNETLAEAARFRDAAYAERDAARQETNYIRQQAQEQIDNAADRARASDFARRRGLQSLREIRDENETLREQLDKRQDDIDGRDRQFRGLHRVNTHNEIAHNAVRIERDRLVQQLATARQNMMLQRQHYDRQAAQLRERHRNDIDRLQRLLTDTRNESDTAHRESRRFRREVEDLRAQQPVAADAAADRSSASPAPRPRSRSRTFKPSPPPAVQSRH
jgi:hypothetical protein